MHKIIASSLIVLGLSATAVMAQTPTNFADVDADGNGELSLTELQTVWPDITEAEFGPADIDASGGLSVDELNALQGAAVPAAPPAGAAPSPEAPADPAAAPAPAM